MEWRCEWCGKPHEADDPPCDNCGHGQFERAVVPAGPEGEGGPLVWVCTDCGREHPRNTPPCSRCGGMDLEKQRQDDVPVEPLGEDDEGTSVRDLWATDEEPEDVPETMTVWACTDCGRAHPRNNPPCSRCGGMSFRQEQRTYDEDGDWREGDAGRAGDAGGAGEATPEPAAQGAGGETMTSWVCAECGRSHPRNNPPCSRCGSMRLEQREQRFDALDASGGGWLDAIDLKVALGFGAVVLLAVLVVGPATGAFDLPGQGPPAVEDVPGESESVGGVALSDVERSFVDRLGEARDRRGASDLSWNRELAALATFHNRWAVKQAYDPDAGAPSEDQLVQAFRSVDSCPDEQLSSGGVRTSATLDGTAVAAFDSADALAAALVDAYIAENGDDLAVAEDGAAGADVHVAPDGSVFVTVYYC